MIRLCSGDIFDADVDIRVNTVNCVGAMGAGVALAFKTRYPEMFREYKKACKDGRIQPGKIHVWKQLDGTWIINFPTKRHWREPSRYEDIEAGLADLRKYLQEQGHVSIAVPALGCGHGGLDWNRVKDMITDALDDLDAEIHLFEPSSSRAAGEQVKRGIDPHVVEQLERDGISILKPGDEKYPEPIRGVRATTIFVKGNPAALGQPLLTVLPSRKPDEKEVSAATACIEAIAKSGMAILLGYGPHIDRALIRLALDKGASVAIRFEEGISNFRVRKDIEDIWDDARIAVIATEATGRWNRHTRRKMTGLALDLAKVALVTDPNPQWMRRFADDATRSCQVFFIDYCTSSPTAKQALMAVGAHAVRRDARSGSPSVDEIISALGVADPQPRAEPVELAAEQAAPTAKTNDREHKDTMPRYPKRLIEVDLPIKRISAHARREKSIRHGHISTLHIWWARRPLAACRAVICASLWPDPADPHCPQDFREAAESVMRAFAKTATTDRKVTEICDDESWKRYGRLAKRHDPMDLHTLPTATSPTPATAGDNLDSEGLTDLERLRGLLLDFIADAAAWEASTNKVFLQTSRNLTQAAHEALGGAPGTRPLVVDPFAGGGAIPIEALRVGADAFASDLNPVAVLLNKVVLEYIPKYGKKLADEVRTWGQWIKEEAEKELAEFYPKDPDGATPIAYLWARTILSEDPGQGSPPIEVPLMRSMWLSKKASSCRALRWKRDKSGQVECETVQVTYVDGQTLKVRRPQLEVFSPKEERDVEPGTVARGSATCPVTGYTTKLDRVRAQLKPRRGGAADARLLCVVTTRTSERGRFYRLPTRDDAEAFAAAAEELEQQKQEDETARARKKGHQSAPVEAAHGNPCSLVPDEAISLNELRRVSVPIYGMERWGDLFSPRQALALSTLARLVRKAGEQMASSDDAGLAKAVQTCLALAVTKHADANCANCAWRPTSLDIGHLFGRQAIGMVWDFAEVNPSSRASRDFWNGVQGVLKALDSTGADFTNAGHIESASATNHPLPDDFVAAFVTDPPYYDAVPYAYLSDFFYVWMRRMLADVHPALFREPGVPKDAEIVVDRPHQLSQSTKDIAFYERELTNAFAEGRRITQTGGVGTIVFASKTTASWEAILKAVVDAGWVIAGSWPIDTEMETRVAAQGQARLASSVHLVTRPRQNHDGSLRMEVGEWRDVLSELPKRIHQWMPRLAAEGVVGADAIFACLGPALEIFSWYSRVEKASGEVVPLREYLEHVWAAVSTEAMSMIFKDADAAGLEPDARLTAMWLWTLGVGTGRAGANGNGKKVVPGMASENDAAEPAGKVKDAGFTLEFDAARKMAQGLGIHLEKSESFVEVKGDKARLLPVAERTKYLFGKDSTAPAASRRRRKPKQKSLFDELDEIEAAEGGAAGKLAGASPRETVLDRLHQAMILFGAGRGDAVKRFLVDDGVGSDTRFWRLAQSLSALYPPGCDEKRWVDGVLARKKGLGF